ncbi:hypothetical protein GF385_01380 [Candidatus Dependentiae bacterium]|nr:hypothetical protein [Candidatus Dependentiae bacterium]
MSLRKDQSKTHSLSQENFSEEENNNLLSFFEILLEWQNIEDKKNINEKSNENK